MKTLLLAGATLALLTAVNLSPAMAQAQTHSGGNCASADKMAPHYEYRYHYGHNGHWEGQWVLVIPPQARGPHLDGAGISEYGAGISE
jgi:Spy/CpxP family protein refolding chaperone